MWLTNVVNEQIYKNKWVIKHATTDYWLYLSVPLLPLLYNLYIETFFDRLKTTFIQNHL